MSTINTAIPLTIEVEACVHTKLHSAFQIIATDQEKRKRMLQVNELTMVCLYSVPGIK